MEKKKYIYLKWNVMSVSIVDLFFNWKIVSCFLLSWEEKNAKF